MAFASVLGTLSSENTSAASAVYSHTSSGTVLVAVSWCKIVIVAVNSALRAITKRKSLHCAMADFQFCRILRNAGITPQIEIANAITLTNTAMHQWE